MPPGTNAALPFAIKTVEAINQPYSVCQLGYHFESWRFPPWPHSAYGRSRHRHPWDWLLDTPSREDYRTWQHKDALDKNACETKNCSISETRHSFTGLIAKSGAMQWQVENSTDEGDVRLLRHFKQRWIEAESSRSALSPTV